MAFQNLGSQNFWGISNIQQKQICYTSSIQQLEVLSFASDKAKLFVENFSKNSNLDNLGVSLPVFPSRTNLKLHNISVTSRMVSEPWFVKGILSQLYSSVGFKDMWAGLSYIMAELFSKCLKESCFPNCWKVSLVFPIFKNVRKRSAAKNYCPVSLLSVVGKVFGKLVNNRIT